MGHVAVIRSKNFIFFLTGPFPLGKVIKCHIFSNNSDGKVTNILFAELIQIASNILKTDTFRQVLCKSSTKINL